MVDLFLWSTKNYFMQRFFNSFCNNSFHGFLLSTSKYCLTHVWFNDFANSLVFGTFSPPFSCSFIITDRLILSVFLPHMKWKMILSNFVKNSLKGSDKTVTIWTRIGRAKVFTMVTLPIIDRFRKDQSCNSFLTLFSFSVKLSFGALSFQEYVSKGITHPVFYGDRLRTKGGQRRSEFLLVGLENSETPSTSSVWPGNHREDYRSWAWPFHSLVQIIP